MKRLNDIGAPGIAETMLEASGFEVVSRGQRVSTIEWPDADLAWRALSSIGPAVPALRHGVGRRHQAGACWPRSSPAGTGAGSTGSATTTSSSSPASRRRGRPAGRRAGPASACGAEDLAQLEPAARADDGPLVDHGAEAVGDGDGGEEQQQRAGDLQRAGLAGGDASRDDQR